MFVYGLVHGYFQAVRRLMMRTVHPALLQDLILTVPVPL